MNKLALLPIAALLTAALPASAASPCDAVVSATLKVLQVPAHLYMTETGGRTRNSEIIYLNRSMYIRVEGQWRKSAVPTKTLAESKIESEDRIGICSVVRDEAVGGEPATLFKVHNKSEDAVDGQIWVSKLRGLPLKQSYDLDVGGGPRGVTHNEIRYEYTNVSAPAVTESKNK